MHFAFGLVLLPMTAVTPSIVTPKVESPQSVLVQKMNTRVESLLAIDAFFTKRDAPLAGLGMAMAIAADKYDLDWRLLPAIATRESNGGEFACKRVENSFFGWGSCTISFDSPEQAIDVVASHLGGTMDSTDQYYKDKTTYQKLRKYNTVIKKYPEQVIKIMDMIGPESFDIAPDTTKAEA